MKIATDTGPSHFDDLAHPYAGRDLHWLLELHASSTPDKPLVHWDDLKGTKSVVTYREMLERANAFAAGLIDLGLSGGDRIILHMENCPQFLMTVFACARIGVIVATTNTRSSASEMAYFIDKIGAKVAVTQSEYHSLFETVSGSLSTIISRDDPDKDQIGSTPVRHFDACLGPADNLPKRNIAPDTKLSIQFTSGTTSRPKAVVFTHANALWGGQMTAQHFGLQSDDISLVLLPMYHVNGFMYLAMATLWVGGSIVVVPRFSASQFWRIATEYKTTFATVIGFHINAIAAQPVPDHSFTKWGIGISGAPDFEAHYGVKLIGYWGMTETVTQGIVSSPFVPSPRFMSMGTPAPEYDIRIVDEEGCAVSGSSEGQTGELFIRGRPGVSLFLEYFGDLDATQSAYDENGWFITGDRVTLFDDGHLLFADRVKDMLKVGGENVAASELEAIISSLPYVRECAVVGKRDPMLEEVPVAFVVLADDHPDFAADVVSHCAEQLADFKVPREVRSIQELPKGFLEKVSKKELRKLLKEQSA